MRGDRREPIAIVGIGCRFPGNLSSPRALWRGLCEGVDGIVDVPAERWDHARFHDSDRSKAGKIANPRMGFLEDVASFDAEFFGMFPAEAARVDPQQRLLLEVAHEALDDAGIAHEQIAGSRTSVFVGAFMYDYLCMQSSVLHQQDMNPYVAMGNSLTSLSNRLSYVFDLKGPSVSVDTACSSSLVAVHLACRSIWAGDADMAFAGGANVMLRPESSILLSRAGFLNADGKCKAFDARADGYVRGEGAGVVFLKRLSDAIRDEDRVYAVIRGTAANQDGFVASGFTVPNLHAQVELLRAAYSDADIDPRTVAYVEAHGPGTSVGDPVETRALGTVIGEGRARDDAFFIGSIKTNIGHLEGASGIAGLIKATLAVHARAVPPNLHFETANPAIDFEGLRLRVPVALERLGTPGASLHVGVNSFGAGGTNAHVVLASFEPEIMREREVHEERSLTKPRLFVVSGAHPDALAAEATALRDLIVREDPKLADVSFTTWKRRTRHAHEARIHARTQAELLEGLSAVATKTVHPAVRTTPIARRMKPKLGLMFSGQGGQWARMGMRLMQAEPVFADAMRRVDAAFARVAGWSVLSEIERDAKSSRITQTTIVQPAIMAVQVAATELLRGYGVEFEGVVGHSVGEVAAAWTAGAYSLEEAAEVIYHRSRIQDRATGAGKMLAVGLTEAEAQRRIAGFAPRIGIAAFNGPASLALAGDADAIDRLARALDAEGVFVRHVDVAVPYHSYFMEPLKADLIAQLGGFSGRRGSLPIYSTVSTAAEDGTHLGGDYWFRNVREPVRFHQAVTRMIADGFDTLIEVGPHPVLAAGARSTVEGSDVLVAEVMNRKENESDTFMHAIGAIIARGGRVDGERLWGKGARFTDMPRYAWQRQRHWFESPEHTKLRLGTRAHPFIKRVHTAATKPSENVVELDLSLDQHSYLRDHCVEGSIVVPATAHIEAALAAALAAGHTAVTLEDMRFESALVLSDDPAARLEVRVEGTSAEGHFTICSRAESATEAAFTAHSRGRIESQGHRFTSRAEDLTVLRESFGSAPRVDVERFYDRVRRAGLDYGSAFRCVDELQVQGDQTLALLSLREGVVGGEPHLAHPTLVDACLHTVFAFVQEAGGPDWVYLPAHVERVKMHRTLPERVWAHVHVTRFDAAQVEFDTSIYTETGAVALELHGLVCNRLAVASSTAADAHTYEWEWVQDSPSLQLSPGGGRWHVIGPRDATVASFVERFARAAPATELVHHDTAAEAARSRVERVIFFAPTPRDTDLTEVSASWTELLRVAQAMAAQGSARRLVLVTRGNTETGDGECPRPFDSVLLGMSRVIRNELTNVSLSVVDVSTHVEPNELDALVAEVRAQPSASEVALRGGRRFVLRLRPCDGQAWDRRLTQVQAASGTDYEAHIPMAGALGALEFRRTPHAMPGPGEIAIDVAAAALNFKDVMNGMGLLSRDAVRGGLTEDRLGLEVSGIVSAVGPGVTSLAIGDAVMARVPRGFVGRAVTPVECAIRKPPSLSFAEAAAVPVAHLTAYYGLHYLARLEPSETMLVHSATGGVGLAAIAIARAKGAHVIATAGSEAKRTYLREQLGIEHVFDSRTSAFYDGVMEATGGRGVDVVLNSLTGTLASESLRTLAPFGRFIEIGKTDIYQNNKLGLERLGENISYFVVDGDRLAIGRPALHRQLFEGIAALLDSGVLPKPEVTTVPIAELGSVLQRMSRAEHLGKLVATMSDLTVATQPPLAASFRKDRSYLVTGGTGGFGLELAEWLAQRGVGALVLVSRQGVAREEDAARIESIRASGVDVRVERLDVANAEQVDVTFARLAQSTNPLGGIVHAAAVLDDAALVDTSPERLLGVLAPKAIGAWNLHRSSLRHAPHLEHFVMISSVSSVVGLQGQVAYAGANCFLDGLAAHRRAQGLSGMSLDIGLLAEFSGMTRRAEERDGGRLRRMLNSQGFALMGRLDVMTKVERAFVHMPVQRVVATLDWTQIAQAYPRLAHDTRFTDVISGGKARARRGGLMARLEASPASERVELLALELATALASILGVRSAEMSIDRGLDALGLDSLTLTQLRSFISRNLDTHYPMMRLVRGPSLRTLAEELLVSIQPAASKTTSQAPVARGPLSDLFDAGVTRVSPWLLRGASTGEPRARIFCFHAVGVGASLFGRYLVSPPQGAEIFAVQTPGREDRAHEAGIASVEELVDRLLPELEPLLDRPFVCWGHSFGGLVARHVVARLEERGFTPLHLVVSATPAPAELARWRAREVLPRVAASDRGEAALEVLKGYSSDAAAAEDLVVLMRKDAPLVVAYEPGLLVPIRTPITGIRARRDSVVHASEFEPWRACTTGAFEMVDVEGDHWFLSGRHAELLDMFGRVLRR